MNLINSIKKHSLHLSCYLMCKLNNITIPFHPTINNMIRYEIIQYRIDNCNLVTNYTFQYRYITWEIVQANPDKPWNYYEVSENPNITWEILQANPDKNWDYYTIILRLLYK